MNYFSTELWCVTKDGFLYDNWRWPAQWLRLRRSSKALPKANLAPKNGHGRCLVVCLLVWSTIAFWIPEKPLHMRSMLSTSTRCIKAAMPAANIAQQKGSSSSPWRHLNTDCTTNISNIEWIGLWSFALSHHIHLTSCQLITTSSSILTTFCRENACTTGRMGKMLCKSSSNP